MKNTNKYKDKKIRQKCLSPKKLEKFVQSSKEKFVKSMPDITKLLLTNPSQNYPFVPNIIKPMAPLQPKNKTSRSQFKVDRNNKDMIYLQIYEWKHLHIFDES